MLFAADSVHEVIQLQTTGASDRAISTAGRPSVPTEPPPESGTGVTGWATSSGRRQWGSPACLCSTPCDARVSCSSEAFQERSSSSTSVSTSRPFDLSHLTSIRQTWDLGSVDLVRYRALCGEWRQRANRDYAQGCFGVPGLGRPAASRSAATTSVGDPFSVSLHDNHPPCRRVTAPQSAGSHPPNMSTRARRRGFLASVPSLSRDSSGLAGRERRNRMMFMAPLKCRCIHMAMYRSVAVMQILPGNAFRRDRPDGPLLERIAFPRLEDTANHLRRT